MRYCEFVDDVCRWCKKASPVPGRVVVRACFGCRHLGDTISQIKVACQCPGRTEAIVAVARCAVYDRCLPHWRPSGDDLAKWRERKPESDIYHLCHGCESFTASAEI